MNKTSLLLCLITMAACNSTTQTTSSGNLFGYPPNAEILEYSDSPGLEKVTVMFANKIEQQGDYLNGNRNGTWTEYHTNGVVKLVTTFVNGQQHGVQIEMDNRGKLIKKAFYHNGVYDGELLHYLDGKISEKRIYSNGNLEGMLSKYYKNGNLMEESNYKAGKIHGTAKWYDQEGNVTLEYEYSDGELVQDGE